MTIKVFDAFSGIGTKRMALRNLGIEHEVVAMSEIDKFAIRSYEAIHGETLNLGDISKIKVEDIPEHDLFTYGFPCQSVSIAGAQAGLEKGSGTRSSLLWECQKVIEGKMPKYLLMENVKNLVGKKFKPFFDEWLEYLESLGYTNYWEILNAKDYGVPQNRERVFVVSILGEHEPYKFPEPQELTVRLKDILEQEVEDKFYMKDERIGKLTFTNKSSNTNVIANGDASSYEQNNRIYNIDKEAPTITARDYKDPKRILEPVIEQVAQYDSPTRKNTNQYRTYSAEGVSPSLTTMGGGGRQPHIVEGELPVIAASRGRYVGGGNKVGTKTQQQLEINKEGLSNTLTTVQKDNYVIEEPKIIDDMYKNRKPRVYAEHAPTLRAERSGLKVDNGFRIRKLTPKECYRLMGVSDEDFNKAQVVNSNTQLYKQAGNAIVVDVLEGIFGNLFTT